jgi:hypothetical protein
MAPQISLASLWLPILFSAAIVFVASSIIHMATPWHKADVTGLPGEDALREALKSVPPGDYAVPYAGSRAAMSSPEFQKKMAEGPIVLLTVRPGGSMSMAANLIQWFIYLIVVGVFAGYLASRALAPGADYLRVFQMAGTVAFAGYSLALVQGSIWYKRSWGYTSRTMIDGLLYAGLTGGTFGWLWPR